MAFLLDSILSKIGTQKEEGNGYDDMNYLVGNTSGLDIGQVPSPIDQRIGRMAQIGGEIMEIQITNPATFQIDRPELMNVIHQLGFDTITLHGDPNIGFTGAYATRGQGVTGYNIVHRYFKRYLEQMASFRYEAEKRGELEEDDWFDVGYVNMHASNEQIPAREERMASDVSVDPFGNFMTNINGGKEKNIYRNRAFLKKMFDYWFLEKIENPWNLYESYFSNISSTFQDRWDEAKEEAADEILQEAKKDSLPFEEYLGVMQTVMGIDQGLETTFLEEIENHPLDKDFRFRISDAGTLRETLKQRILQNPENNIDDEQRAEEMAERTIHNLRNAVEKEFSTLGDITDLMVPTRGNIFNNPRALSRDIFELGKGASGEVNMRNIPEGTPKDVLNDFRNVIAQNQDVIKNSLEKMLREKIWSEASADAKERALQQNIGIGRNEISERAQELPKIRENAAKKAFSGDKEFYSDEEYEMDGKPKYMHILDRIASQRYSEEFNKESSIFFHILPAWMQESEFDDAENHEGWDVPKFIWENTLERSVERSDVTDDAYFDDWSTFEKFLEERRENELNVIAAVGACYLWGHFTQKEDPFDLDAFDLNVTSFDEYEKPELKGEEGEKGDYTWIEWMNEFGLKVNIEAMYGEPGQLTRLWRPKDIAIACHAINQEARNMMGEDYDENLVKFTIDLEHTSSYGVDPLNEMEILVDQEEKMAKEGKTEADPEKPLAKIVKTYHLTKPGWEQQQGHRHGPFTRGDETLYYWLHNLVKNGFARNEEDEARIIFEVGGEYREEMYVIKVAMDMIQLGITPDDLDPNVVDPGGDYKDEKEALIARFFGMDQPNYSREWAKIEEHAFDPLQGLLEADQFDYTWSSSAAIQNDNRPDEWSREEYK